eukprot:2848517-Rhodomonas_salina.1
MVCTQRALLRQGRKELMEGAEERDANASICDEEAAAGRGRKECGYERARRVTWQRATRHGSPCVGSPCVSSPCVGSPCVCSPCVGSPWHGSPCVGSPS